jgi:hypothetical protein
MDPRVATELQQVIFKKDQMILLLQKQLQVYRKRFGALDEKMVQEEIEELENEENAIATSRRERSSSISSIASSSPRRSSISTFLFPEQELVSPVATDPTSFITAASTITQRQQQLPQGLSFSSSSLSSSSVLSAAGLVQPFSPPSATKAPTTSIFASPVISCTGKNVSLDFVEDSPMFRRQLEGFEESLSGLRSMFKEILSHTKEYVAAGMRFGEEESAFAEEVADRKYARALFTTSCPELGSLSTIFGEFHDIMTQLQSSRVSMLLSIEALLSHAINRFSEHGLKEAGELRKEVSRLADEYESQLAKVLAKPASTNSGSITSSSSSSSSNMPSERRMPEKEVMQARLRFELARFDLVRYLNRVDCQKKVRMF